MGVRFIRTAIKHTMSHLMSVLVVVDTEADESIKDWLDLLHVRECLTCLTLVVKEEYTNS